MPPSQQGCFLPLDRFPLAVRPSTAWAATLAATAVACWIRYVAVGSLPPGFPFVSFFPVVILISVLFGTRHGSAAAVLGGVLAWYLFIPPYGVFNLDRGSLTAMGFYTLVVATDILFIHWLQRANSRLAQERERSSALAQTRALLFDELQHRVSNNLQAVAGLLALQRRRLADPHAAAALAEASQRVALIGRISRRLYDADENGKDLAAFLTALLDEVVEANGRSDIARRVDCPRELRLSTEQALPVALVVAESIANAIEHGLSDHGAPAIGIDVRATDRHLTICVIDNGGKLPDGFTAEASSSLGLSIATTLARQTGGTYAITGGLETRACLTMPQAQTSHLLRPPAHSGRGGN